MIYLSCFQRSSHLRMLRFLTRELKTVRRGCNNRISLFRDVAARFASTNSGGGSGRLEGKVAIITGGASGIGKATSMEFIQQGARVIIADIDTQLGQQSATELGPQAQFIPCDVTDETQISNTVDLTIAQHGKLDIMYNNAGIPGPLYPPSIVDMDLNQFDTVMRVNVRGIMAGIKHAARVMVPARSGVILCTASISGLMGGLGTHAYTVSKFAIPGIVKSVASELCKYGVRINCVSPCPIPTEMVVRQFGRFYEGVSEEVLKDMVARLGGLDGVKCEEIDVAKAAVYLVSDDAKYVSGHNLVVDGGFTSYKNLNLPTHESL